ncbi:MAG: hypothetical protein WD038_09010 [Balneolales bacterium]
MSFKFKNKYRIATTRLPNWNYGWNAAYFVTICTAKKKCYFGDVCHERNNDSLMLLSDIGKSAETCWYKIPEHFPFVLLGDFVVMPNHVHGIIGINKQNDGSEDIFDLTAIDKTGKINKQSGNRFGPQSKNLASIVRGYKIGVTKQARLFDADFAWQPRFYEHIIRNEQSFQRISKYINSNPENWKDDKFYVDI